MTKLANSPEQFLKRSMAKYASRKRVESGSQGDYRECPRGFGNIRKLGSEVSVSERYLGCYRIMECYGENENNEPRVNSV